MSGWDIKGKTVLITGATDGIGYAAALALAKRGAHLVLTARSNEKGEQTVTELKKKSANDAIQFLICDLASLSSVKQCVEEYLRRFQTLHVLINVAGVMPVGREESADGIELNMAVNYFAPVLLTELLIPLMKKSAPARVINVTSSLHSRGHIDLANVRGAGAYDRYLAYSTSKLALMLYTFNKAKTLAQDGITVNAVHPGWIRTKLAVGALGKSNALVQFAFPFLKMRTPAYGARSIVYLAAEPSAGDMTGAYIIKNEATPPSSRAQDAVLGEQLLAETKKILAPYL